ncbi:AzlD domain-containing protein [Pseudonocardia sp. DSM 110487]|uniref:branched-chain amino acid transporter permease n=1 Tax=Pseudonocardia sp. DSM 110487 TaxID=2865833 RepID=UPI001C6A1EB6|nr:AzlD domain-containing protein [Pseudonocardia sp. DSM 110487]QYN35171.1 AzlD domain-containing protein [Pseudonocardia sp. DSM 110487]
MPDAAYLTSVVAIAAAVTWTLRALPFALLAPLRASKVVPYLAASMPAGVMAILVIHTLRDVPPYGAAVGIALAATVALHVWRRNVVLSIAGGTAVHVVLASLVFTG